MHIHLIGDKLRLKTKGSSIIVDFFSKSQQSAQNYGGEDVLGGWTSKIKSSSSSSSSATAANEDTKKNPADSMQGADDSGVCVRVYV